MTDVRTSLHPFYVTFGVQYSRTPSDLYGTETHPYWPEGADKDGWVRIMAKTHDQAVNLARAYFGERYAFIYPADRFDTTKERKWFPLGELAVIELGSVPLPGNPGDAPQPIVTTSEPNLYGVADHTTVAARIEGELIGRPNPEASDVELVHRDCLDEGRELFVQVFNVDTNVMAFELDWAVPHECPVCHVSIT